MKRRYSLRNLLAIPLIIVGNQIATNFVNASLVFLLKNENFFNIAQDFMGRVSNDLTFYSIIPTMIFSFFMGYIYDLFGRKYTIFLCFLMAAVIMFFLPWTSPTVYPWLILLKIFLDLTMAAPLGHPLVTDYVKKESRGTATAVQGFGFIIGNIFAFGILFNLTKDLHPYIGFGIAAGTLAIIAIVLLVIVKDPEMDKLHKATFTDHIKTPLLQD